MPSILSSEFWINKGGEEHLVSASHNNALYFSLLQMIFKLGCKSFEGQFQWRGKTMITSEYPPIASAWSTLTSLTSSWCSRQERQKFFGVVENFLMSNFFIFLWTKVSHEFQNPAQSVPQSLVFASIVCISFCSFSSFSPQTLNSSWKLTSIKQNVKGTYTHTLVFLMFLEVLAYRGVLWIHWLDVYAGESLLFGVFLQGKCHPHHSHHRYQRHHHSPYSLEFPIRQISTILIKKR